jgi:hypothetical protein
MCGSIKIDGHTFCLRLKSLELSYTASPELQTITYLIKQASLRSKYTKNSPQRFFLKIRPLAKLVNMFQFRKAFNPCDKVYTLLNISSNDPSKAGLRPNYEVF